MSEPSGDGHANAGEWPAGDGPQVMTATGKGVWPASSAIAVVELRIADEEPWRSFVAAVGTALSLFADVDAEEIPVAARQGLSELRAASELLGVSIPARTAPADFYHGVIIIEWPAAHGATPYSSMLGRTVSITDALTGKPIRTCTSLTVRADMESFVTADLTMFATEGGRPLLEGEPVPDGDSFRTGVFPFFVSEMRIRKP